MGVVTHVNKLGVCTIGTNGCVTNGRRGNGGVRLASLILSQIQRGIQAETARECALLYAEPLRAAATPHARRRDRGDGNGTHEHRSVGACAEVYE